MSTSLTVNEILETMAAMKVRAHPQGPPRSDIWV